LQSNGVLVAINAILDLQHPFSAGITLSGFTVISVDGKWEKAFVPSTAGAIHKVSQLVSRSNESNGTFQAR
jgi:hypothetical protein